ncbi:ABC transporter ATP-binding protein [Actinomadura violacea]|uniref:ABC transporter ATP-binding protein n=1 Tax=Actinomadura violacea TaxID=2819934 RepID=A0ABS3RW99_9ACTN|nr:ABC transporter ATP-binding protein [Actinomadura violacea]MBO2461037.1 ABC transporter ATP-binding protein [Actinomadura violacea]
MEAPALALEGVAVDRAEVPVVHDVALEAARGEVTVVLGANGAGKTTLMDGIAGLAQVKSGTVRLAGTAVEKLAPYKRARAGLGYVEQARTTFRTLTVEQNLLVSQRGDGDLATVYRLFPELDKRRGLQAGHLSGGEQQMVVLGRALVSAPKVVLIDEMSLGLAPLVVRRLMTTVGELAGMGIAVVLIEQFANLALDVGTSAHVLRKGRIVFSGPCAELRGDERRLHRLYFGGAPSAGGPRSDGAEPGGATPPAAESEAR